MPDASAAIDAKLRAAKPAKPPLKIRKFSEMLAPDLQSRYLVKGILETAAVALIYGESGCGKTFLTLDLALHVAAGWEWFGQKVRQGRVVYVAAEAGPSIERRVAAFAIQKAGDDAQIDFAAVVSPVDLCHLGKGDDIDRLVAAIGRADLVVIDTVSRALAGGNENAPDDMGAFVRALDDLRDKLGCAIVAVHHVGKDASRGGRGHSLLHCAVDTEIEVERRDNDTCVATVTKQRDGPGGGEVAFKLKQVELGADQDGDPVTSCVVESTDWVPEAKSKVPTGQAKEALDVLNQALAERGELRPCGDFEIRAVKVEVWREYMEKSGLFEKGANFRNAWARARAKLVADGHVELRDGYVRPTRPSDELPF